MDNGAGRSYAQMYRRYLFSLPAVQFSILAALFFCGWLAYHSGVGWGVAAVIVGLSAQ
jgi:hypothetical protein